MVAPNLMYEHTLNAIKGWFQPAALDFDAVVSANVTVDLPAGRVVHLNAVGEFQTGVEGTHMGIFLLQGTDAADVANDGTTLAGNFMHQAIMPTGVNSGLVATGAYELESTEFNSALDYPPNQCLTATINDANATTGGRLTTGTAYTNNICGVVSRGVYTNAHGISVLAFWPVWLPEDGR